MPDIIKDWIPMLVSMVIILPILLIFARMAYTVSQRLTVVDIAATERERKRKTRPSRKQVATFEENQSARQVEIVKYRSVSAYLVIASAAIVAGYGIMVSFSIPEQPVVTWGLALLLVALVAVTSYRLLIWARGDQSQVSASDDDDA